MENEFTLAKAALAAAVSAGHHHGDWVWEGAGGRSPRASGQNRGLSGTGGSLDREFAADIHRAKSRVWGSDVGGKVSARDVGQTAIKEGQVLARLDPQRPNWDRKLLVPAWLQPRPMPRAGHC